MARIDKELLNYKSIYEKDGVLINKLGIQDTESLNKIERVMTSYKLAKLYIDSGKQTFDVDHYLSIHKFLFEDIYPFAGEIRSENIEKSIPFCLPQYVYQSLKGTLYRANIIGRGIKNREDLLFFLTDLYADLNVIHPFREGNGRCQREYLRQLIDYICKNNNLEPYYLDYDAVEDIDAFIKAIVDASACIDPKKLYNEFDKILKVKQLVKEDEKTR